MGREDRQNVPLEHSPHRQTVGGPSNYRWDPSPGPRARPLSPRRAELGSLRRRVRIARRALEEALVPLGASVTFASTRAPGVSHWFVRVAHPQHGTFNIDLTGDQFLPRVNSGGRGRQPLRGEPNALAPT